MEIKIIGRHINVYDNVRRYAEDKAAKLERFHNQIQAVDLTLSAEGEEKKVEMVIRVRSGGPFRGEEKQGDFLAAIDLLVDKMSRQLKKAKEKLKVNHHKSGRAAMAEPAPEPDPDDDLESYDDVIEKVDFGTR